MSDEHDRGLGYDLPRLVSRRTAVGLLAGGVGSAVLAACGSSGGDATTTTTTSAAAATGDTAEIPEETAGPFPGDGSNGPDVLSESGVVRRDISRSFGDASGTAEGVKTTVQMTLLDVSAGGAPLAGAAVYLWHCDREGRYSLYDADISGENYLRGVQVSAKDGTLRFDTIFPGAYAGRWPHMHFEIYDKLGGTKLRTSQIALPQATCERVYAASGYEQSVQNLAQTSLDSDMVFSDGYASQLAKAGGSANAVILALNVGV
jgi:protocatechuate 3,4-dioxygenase beta subunit